SGAPTPPESAFAAGTTNRPTIRTTRTEACSRLEKELTKGFSAPRREPGILHVDAQARIPSRRPTARIIRIRAMRRLSLILAVLALFGALGASSAQASPWTLTTLGLGDGETIFGMHCDQNGYCIGVGQEGVVIQSSAPTAGAGAWAIAHVTPTEGLAANLRGISCPTAALCVAVDFSGGVWTTRTAGLGASSWTP